MKKNYESKQQTYMHGMLVLVVATALVKIIGAVYRIPLANLLGETGMGYYSTAYDLYLPMYSLAMAGLPVAISRIIAEHVAAGRYKDVKVTLKVARKTFWVTGGVGFLLMCLLAYPFILYTKNSGALTAIFCIAPCLLICCVMSLYRGYYEGLKNMRPTAVSEVLEALGKLVLGFGFAFIVIKLRGNTNPETLSFAAAGALLGITVGTAVSAMYLVIKYRRDGQIFSVEQLNSAPDAASESKTFKLIVSIAVPVVLGSLVTYLTSLIDVVMVQRQLAAAIDRAPEVFEKMYAGFIESKQNEALLSGSEFTLKDLPNALYGCHRGYAYSVFNLVPVLASVMGVSAIPILASAWTKKDSAEVKKNMETVFRITALVAVPAGLGLFAIAGPVLGLLYSSKYAVQIATPNLRTLGIAAVFAGLTVPMTNVLQAIGKQKIPVRNIAIGAVVKIIVNIILVGIPEINIKGVPIGTACYYIVVFVGNYIAIRKYSGVRLNLVSVAVKPFLSAALCALSAFVVTALLGRTRIITIIALMVAVIVYVIAISVFKAIETDDILSLPKGEKIANVLRKLKILRS